MTMPRKPGGKFSYKQVVEAANQVPSNVANVQPNVEINNSQSVNCSICSQCFSSDQYLRKHIKYAHYVCDVCDETVEDIGLHKEEAHYSVSFSTDVCAALHFYSNIPSQLLETEKRKLVTHFKEAINVNLHNIDIEKVVPIDTESVKRRLHEVSISSKMSFLKILVPPTKDCLHCERRLKLANAPVHVVVFDVDGPLPALKYSYRCQDCPVFQGEVRYTLDKFSRLTTENGGLSFYDEAVSVIKGTNRAYISRTQMQSFIRTFFHCWASFSGNCEAYNDSKLDEAERCRNFLEKINDTETDDLPVENEEELGPSGRHLLERRLLSRSFRIFMAEEELRERKAVSSWSFVDDKPLSSYDAFMEFVDKNKGSYQHECTKGCKERGCKFVYVMDGIWKLNYPHCMFYNPCRDVNTEVSLPPVCTKAPRDSMAFCDQHCEIVEQRATGIQSSIEKFSERSWSR